MTDTAETLPILDVWARPAEPQIPAGAPVEIAIRLMPEEGADLTGLTVDLLDADGAARDRAEVLGPTPERRDAGGVLIEAADGSYVTSPIRLTAPRAVGPFDLSLAVRDPDDAEGEAQIFSATLHVDAHQVGLSVWDVPRSVQPDAEFAFRVGMSCADGCDTTGWIAEVQDGDGTVIASAAMGDAPWKGTDGLHFSEIRATAPGAEGRHDWTVRALPSEQADLAHADCHAALRLLVSPAPEFRIRVETLDEATGAPLKGAKIVADPYRAVADENGIAELLVHRGAYRLFVSGPSHIARRFDADVTKDLAFRAALARDEGFTDADLW